MRLRLSLVVVLFALLQDPFPNPFTQPPVPLATLTVSKAGAGSGTVTGTGIACGADCSQVFNRGASVTLTATATTGTFTGWSGACTGTGACVVSMSGAQLVTATFTVVTGGGACTPGVNCYCDKVRTGGVFADSALLFCEDFEAPTLECTGADAPACASRSGNGAPYYGGPVDHVNSVSGIPAGDRGGNSYWAQKYQNGVGAVSWQNPEPAASPTFGVQCNPGGSGICFGAKFWDAANRWQANALTNVGVVVLGATTDFNSEVATITRPTGASNGGSGVFDGARSIGFRVPRGNNCSPADSCANVGYLSGQVPIGGWGFRREFGVTAAVAFPNNIATSGVVNTTTWKFDEWVNSTDTDGIFMFGFGGEAGTNFPFYQFTFNHGTGNCSSTVSGTTVLAGRVECDGPGNFLWRASQTDGNLTQRYVQATDWPFGTWGCVQAYYQNMGLANSHIQMWFTGPAGVQKKIVDIANVNLTGFNAGSGYSGFRWNAYSNHNQGLGAIPTTQTTFRYMDNYHVRAGAPVSCAQIGFP